MRETPTDGLGYVQAVERFWLLLRRRGLMISAEDVQQITRWRDAGVPVRVVCRALVDGANRFRRSHAGEEPLPSSLRYFWSMVDEAARQFFEQASVRVVAAEDDAAENDAAPPEPVAEAGALAALLEPLVAAGQAAESEGVREAYRAAYRRLRDLGRRLGAGATGRDAAFDVIEELVAVDQALVDEVVSGMPPVEREALEREVAEALRAEDDRLGERGRPERQRALVEDIATRRWGLIRLVPAPPDGPEVAGMGWWRPAKPGDE